MSEKELTRYRRWLNENPMTLVCVVSFGLGGAFVGLLTGSEHGEGTFGAMLGGTIGLVGGIVSGIAFGAVYWVLERIIIILVRIFAREGVFPHLLARAGRVALVFLVLALAIWIVGGVLGLLKIGWTAL